MIEFNSDGSIKVPDGILKRKKDNEFRMKNGLCITIRKEVISDKSPKKCILHITPSEKLKGSSFVANVYGRFMDSSQVPSRLSKKCNEDFDIEIGTCFSRCKDCTNLLNFFKECLEGNIILEKGSCSFEQGSKTFCYED